MDARVRLASTRGLFRASAKTSSVLFEHPVAGNGRVLLKVDDLEGTSVERDIFPKWFVDHALNEAPEPESPKLSFVLSPGEDSNLPEISPSGVSAPKILGAKKIREFIAKKLSELANPPTVPEGSIRLSCAGVDVLGGDASKEDQTLASIHASVWKNRPRSSSNTPAPRDSHRVSRTQSL